MKVQNDTFTRLLAFNSFTIFQVNEEGLPNAPHTGVQKLIRAMSSFGTSETTLNPSAIRKGFSAHDLFSEDEVAHRVHMELAKLLVLPCFAGNTIETRSTSSYRGSSKDPRQEVPNLH